MHFTYAQIIKGQASAGASVLIRYQTLPLSHLALAPAADTAPSASLDGLDDSSLVSRTPEALALFTCESSYSNPSADSLAQPQSGIVTAAIDDKDGALLTDPAVGPGINYLFMREIFHVTTTAKVHEYLIILNGSYLLPVLKRPRRRSQYSAYRHNAITHRRHSRRSFHYVRTGYAFMADGDDDKNEPKLSDEVAVSTTKRRTFDEIEPRLDP